MKKLIAILLSTAVLLCLAGCNKNEASDKNESTVSTSTSEQEAEISSEQESTDTNTSQTTKGDETNTKENITDDIDVMLDYLSEAKEIGERVSDINSNYNNDSVSAEDTISKLKTEQSNLNALISKVNSTQWKSAKYDGSRSDALDYTLKEFNTFFTSVIAAYEDNNSSLVTKANAYLKSFTSSANSLLNDIEKDKT